MANPEHLAILKQGVEIWNQWREENSLIIPDLTEASLHQARLFDTNLSNVILTKADLSGAYMSNANLNATNLSETNLSGADLSGTRFTGANLEGALLLNTNFINAICGRTLFANTDLSTVKGLHTLYHQAPSSIDIYTLSASQNLPHEFLHGCGLSDGFIEFLPILQKQPIKPLDCFIVYSHADKAFARRLHDTLQAHGVRCWRDEQDMKPPHEQDPEQYEEAINNIRSEDIVLLCCSDQSLTSWWVEDKIVSLYQKETIYHKSRLITLDLDGFPFSKYYTSENAPEIRSRLVANFKGWETDDAIFEHEVERVIAALQTDEGREDPPTPKL